MIKFAEVGEGMEGERGEGERRGKAGGGGKEGGKIADHFGLWSRTLGGDSHYICIYLCSTIISPSLWLLARYLENS
jgi:hypothetical protein